MTFLLRACLAGLLSCFSMVSLNAVEWPVVEHVDRQPLLSQIKRVREALQHLGAPLTSDTVHELEEASDLADDDLLTARVQQILDPLSYGRLANIEQASPGDSQSDSSRA